MNLDEKEIKIKLLEEKLLEADPSTAEFMELKEELEQLKIEAYTNLSAWDRVLIARSASRLKGMELINSLITDYIELKGDQYYSDDQSISAGIGFLDDKPVTIIAQVKGNTLQENLDRNFGMTSPEGFRKSLRLAHQAEKFQRPIITIVDTSGAYPGVGAEKRGQARAIANCLMEFSKLSVPVISIVLSEGGSGGALALTVSDYIIMFENAVYSILSPEGLASILFKDTSRVKDVCEYMKLTSKDLKDASIVDEIIKEPLGGVRHMTDELSSRLKRIIKDKIKELEAINKTKLLSKRYDKYRRIGALNGN